jgi:hypothetical protein
MSGAGWRQFAANEVLTSTNVQNYLQDQTVMRFASATARNSAITAPTQGMTAFLDSTGITTQYFSAGTAGRATAGWYPIGPQLVKQQVIGTGVSSVTVTGAFTNDYDSYRIVISGGLCSAICDLSLKLGGAGSGYLWSRVYAGYGSGVSYNNSGVSGDPSFQSIGFGSASTPMGFDVQIRDPYSPCNTLVTSLWVNNASASGAGSYGGYLDNQNQYTAFTITPSTGTMTGGIISVYGWN